MAKLYHFTNKNVGKHAAYLLGQVLCAVVPLAALVAYNVTRNLVLVYLAALTGAVGLYFFRKWKQQAAILQSGLQGERAMAKLLRRLPRTCAVLLNPVYLVSGRKIELDAIVVSEAGVFLVETKNTAGDVEGEVSAPLWRHTRSGKGGKTIEKQMKNPLQQNERQVSIISQLLRQSGCDIPVKGLVFFSNDYIHVHVKDARLHTSPDALLRAIERSKASCTSKQQRAAILALRKHRQR